MVNLCRYLHEAEAMCTHLLAGYEVGASSPADGLSQPQSPTLQFEALASEKPQVYSEKTLGLRVLLREPTRQYNVEPRRKFFLRIGVRTPLSEASCRNLVGVRFILSMCSSQMLSPRSRASDIILQCLRRLKCRVQPLAPIAGLSKQGPLLPGPNEVSCSQLAQRTF